MLVQANSIAFRLSGIPVYWYVTIIVSGITLAVWLSNREAVCAGLKRDDVSDFILWGLPAIIVGARLYYVAFQRQDYVDNLIEIFFTQNSGLAIYGSFIGRGLTPSSFTHHRFISTWAFLNTVAPGAILVQAIGCWDSFMNHGVYGPTTIRQSLENPHLSTFITDNMNISGMYHQPTFLYESVWNVLGFTVLVLLRKKSYSLKEGEVFLGYIMWYSSGRPLIEGLRMGSSYTFSSIRVSQLLSLVMFVTAIVIAIVRRRNPDLEFYS